MCFRKLLESDHIEISRMISIAKISRFITFQGLCYYIAEYTCNQKLSFKILKLEELIPKDLKVCLKMNYNEWESN